MSKFEYEFQLDFDSFPPQNTNIGVEIFDVDAIDADHGANAILLYFIDTVQSDLGTNTTVYTVNPFFSQMSISRNNVTRICVYL